MSQEINRVDRSDEDTSSQAKKICVKGILKSSSFDKQGGSNRKSAKFDELNVLQTYHPPDKDYGHMKVEEPKTPYNYMDPSLADADELDAKLLTEKLKEATEVARRASLHAESSDEEDDVPETEEEKARRLEFEKRRKAHYVNEFEASKLARKLIKDELNLDGSDRKILEEDEDDDDDDEEGSNDPDNEEKTLKKKFQNLFKRNKKKSKK